MYAQKRNFTYIDELPDLEDLESNGMPTRGQPHTSGRHLQFSEQDHPRGIPPDKFRKFIRSSMGPPPSESGMSPYTPNPHSYPPEFFQTPPTETEPPRPTARPTACSPTCLDISDHVGSCPICSRLYNNDKSIYIIAIVLLSIICILLLKRVLNL